MSRLAQLAIGDVLTGTVTQTTPHGVFVRIADDADGLLYGETAPQVGTAVTVRILDIDPDRQRASLALAQP